MRFEEKGELFFARSTDVEVLQKIHDKLVEEADYLPLSKLRGNCLVISRSPKMWVIEDLDEVDIRMEDLNTKYINILDDKVGFKEFIFN